MLDPNSEGTWLLCYAVGGILPEWFGSTCHQNTRNQNKVVRVLDHLYPMMKHFFGATC